jgi:HK97 family phage portal protein
VAGVGLDANSMSFADPESSTLALSAAWRCLNILTNGIGALELFAIDDSEDNIRIRTPKVLSDPWPAVSPVEWRSMLVSSLALRGNAYMLPFDEDPRTGYPRQLPIVHPDRMHVEMVNGRMRYWVDENRVSDLDVLHVRGYTPPGSPMGVGIVEMQRRGIQLATSMDMYQIGQLATSAVPPVVIRVNRPEVSKEQAEEIQMRWMSRHGNNQRVPAVIPTSMEVTPVAWSPEDQQFLEAKQYMAVEVCWWFGIDPRLLSLAASGQSLTYANVETTYVDLQRMSFMPWTSRIESALSRVLPRSVLARFDFAPMLRTTLQDRFMAYKTAIEGRWLTVDEVRVLENMGPLGTDPHEASVGYRSGRIESVKGVNQSLPVVNTEASA